MIRVENIDDIISLTNRINGNIEYINSINDYIMDTYINRVGLKKYKDIRVLLAKKQKLVDEIKTLRKEAVGIVFKDSGDYTYIDDKSEFKVNKKSKLKQKK